MSDAAQTPHEAALDALGIDRERHQETVDELVKRNESSTASPSPRCACVNVCGDVPEASDHQNAHCRGLPVQPEKLVELVTVPRV